MLKQVLTGYSHTFPPMTYPPAIAHFLGFSVLDMSFRTLGNPPAIAGRHSSGQSMAEEGRLRGYLFGRSRASEDSDLLMES